MGHYKSNLRDLEFNLFEMFARQEVLGSGPYAELDTDTARSALEEVKVTVGVSADELRVLHPAQQAQGGDQIAIGRA